VSSVGLRPHTVYGPGRDQGVTSAPTLAMLSAAAGRAYAIPFGGAVRMQYVADAGEAFVRASEAAREGASVHHLDGPVVAMDEVVAAIERARPEAAGLVTAGADPLPFPAAVDATSFVELVGGPVSRSFAEGAREAIERFGELLADGRVRAPE
jgi:nucleoside-diphosphate-sugar epimerase